MPSIIICEYKRIKLYDFVTFIIRQDFVRCMAGVDILHY